MNLSTIISELNIKAVRSSGAGGQNVNKVSSKVVLKFDVDNSAGLSEDEKRLIVQSLSSRLTSENILILNSDEDRSQIRNKEIGIKRFVALLTKALVVPKVRKATKVPKSVIKKRLRDKKNLSEIKQSRRKPNRD